jgi:hypothetical protein
LGHSGFCQRQAGEQLIAAGSRHFGRVDRWHAHGVQHAQGIQTAGETDAALQHGVILLPIGGFFYIEDCQPIIHVIVSNAAFL